MSLESRADRAVPELAALVVRASFPKGTLAVCTREALRPLVEDGSFAEAFCRRGRPGVSPGAFGPGVGAAIRRGAYRPAGC